MRDAETGTTLRSHMLLFSRFLRNPRTVGALAPSSRALAEAMVAHVDFSRPGRIVELGPGTGALTAPIVERLGPHIQFLAVDIDPAFCDEIQKRWPSVNCVCASAERLDAIVTALDMMPIDHIVSGLPFVSLPAEMTRQILESIAAVLEPGGTFTTFQYLHGYRLPSAVAFRKQMSHKMGHKPHVRLVLKNLLPALVMTWQKT